MPQGRHRAPDHGPSNPVHRDSGGMALPLLALLGQAADLLAAERPTAVSVPDIARPAP